VTDAAKRARILHITRNLPPLVGGMERLNWHIADEAAPTAAALFPAALGWYGYWGAGHQSDLQARCVIYVACARQEATGIVDAATEGQSGDLLQQGDYTAFASSVMRMLADRKGGHERLVRPRSPQTIGLRGR
jgi:hypothetical protein